MSRAWYVYGVSMALENAKLVTLKLVGTSPLLVHNLQSADPRLPENQTRRQLKTKKSKITDVEVERLHYLDWYMSLYLVNKVPMLPAENVRQSIRRGAMVHRGGTDVLRAVNVLEQYVPIQYNGPTDLKELYADGRFTDYRMGTIGGGKVTLVRPKFPEWTIDVQFLVYLDILNAAEFERFVKLAGAIEGVGNGRKIGMGRFQVAEVSYSDQVI